MLICHDFIRYFVPNSLPILNPKEYLDEEESQLNALINVIDPNHSLENELDIEIKQLTKDLNKINKLNKQNLNELKIFIDNENTSQTEMTIKNFSILNIEKKKGRKNIIAKNFSDPEIIVKYLKHCILRLEFKQLAESAEFINSFYKGKGNFNIFFIFYIYF